MKKLLLSIGVILAIIFSLADFTPFVSATLFIPAQLQPFILAGSGVSAGATSITLTSLKDIDGNALTMSNFGYKGYVTIEPGKSGREEQASFTGITGNTLTGVSHVAFTSTSTSFTETSGLTKSHPGGATVVVSNTSGFYSQYAAKVNDESITGSWSFPVPTSYYNPVVKGWGDANYVSNSTTTAQTIASNLTASGTLNVVGQATFTLAPQTSVQCATGNALCNKTYVDAQVVAGGIPMTTSVRGTAYLSVAAASSTAPIVVGDNDPRIIASTTANGAIVKQSGTITSITASTSGNVLTSDGTNWISATAPQSDIRFGDGSDGDVTVTSTLTLSRDMMYKSLTVNAGATINTNGYVIYSSSPIINNGTIQANGGDGGNATAGTAGLGGTAVPKGTLATSTAGVDGAGGVNAGTGNNGNNGTSNPSIGVNGVAGGNGGNGNFQAAGTGGTAGTATYEAVQTRWSFNPVTVATSSELSVSGLFRVVATTSGITLSPSAGSGSGASGGTENSGVHKSGGGGGSGASGGIVLLAAPTITNNASGTIQANGGKGGNGGISEGGGAGSGGGGGGGSGGSVILIYKTLTNSGTIQALGGTKGAGGLIGSGNAAGSDGTNGLAGYIYKVKLTNSYSTN